MEEQVFPEEKEIQLMDYWRVLMKRRWIALGVFLVCVTTVALYSLTMTPIYRATAQILIEKANSNVLSTQDLMAIDTSGTDFYQTQYKILESRTLAREVISRLDLTRFPEFKPYPDSRQSGASPSQLSLPVKNTVNDSALVTKFLKKLKIEPIRNSRMVKVNFESENPQLAAQAANTLARAYIDWSLGLRLQTQQNAAVFLDEQVKETKRKLEASEQGLQQYREKFGVAALTGSSGTKDNPQATHDISRQKMAQVNAQLGEVTNKRIEAEINYRQAKELLQNPEKAESIPEAVNNPVIIAIKNQEVQLMRERTEKSEKFGPKHPTMEALTQELEGLRKKKLQDIRNIVDSMKSKYEIALSQERSLQAALGRSQVETINRDKVAIQYQVLQQEVDSSRGLYDMLLKRLKETNVNEENRTMNIHVVDPAETPKNPAKPRLMLNLLLSCLVGLMLGVGLSFFMEYIDNTIKTPADLKQYFNLPYLGPVPNFEIKEDVPGNDLIILTSPKSSSSEAFRGLRTNILFSSAKHVPQVILVTSSAAQEGKTLISSNLAVAMAQGGVRTLILDCDMRRPRMNKIFGLPRDPGMSNILVGESSWEDLVRPTPVDKLWFIPSGPIPPNPAELVSSDLMEDLVGQLRGRYDRIIIDSPPVTAVTDSVALSRLVDGLVLVIKTGVTSRDIINSTVRALKEINAKILGVVLNDIPVGKDSYYYYQYHYYYYGDDKDKKHKKKGRRHSRPETAPEA
jgi:capsular exopolysaccharide synthesis family protein